MRGLGASRDRFDNGGDGLTVGIVDSVADVDAPASIDVRNGTDFYPRRPRDPLDHGTHVFRLLAHYLPEATFRLYRIVGGRAKQFRENTALLNAITVARSDDVDILNVSAGVSDAPSDPASISGSELDALISRGVRVVSSYGNFVRNLSEAPAFPATHSDVVGVSGYEPICEYASDSPPSDIEVGRYTHVSTDFEAVPRGTPLYCGYEQYEGAACEQADACSLTERCWDGNVTPAEGDPEPDVFCPPHYPVVSDGALRRRSGSSFAAPIVTAVVARVLSALPDSRTPSGEELRTKLRTTGTPLTAGEGSKPDAPALYSALEPSVDGIEVFSE